MNRFRYSSEISKELNWVSLSLSLSLSLSVDPAPAPAWHNYRTPFQDDD